jgi:hypothetical protein
MINLVDWIVPVTMKTLLKKLLKGLSTILLGILTAIVILEIGIRLFMPQPLTPVVAQPDLFTAYRLKENISGFYDYPEFYHTVRTNTYGLRDNEFPKQKPPGTVRILVLGDSFTYGWGVPLEQTYAKILEKHLKEEGWPVQIINTGVGGWGTAHELAYLEQYGLEFSPNLVLIGLTSWDDEDSLASGLYSLQHGKLVKNPPQEHRGYYLFSNLKTVADSIPIYPFLAQRSHLINWFRRILVVIAEKQALTEARNNPGNDGSIAQIGSSQQDYKTLLFESLLKRLQTVSEQAGADLVLVFIPTTSTRHLALNDFCVENEIHCLDLSNTFQQQGNNWQEIYYYPIDGHWNEQGHRLAASAIYDFLEVNELLAQGQ